MSVEEYLLQLQKRLDSAAAGNARLLEEMSAHLDDTARELEMGGLARGESEAEAKRRFGHVDDVATSVVVTGRTLRRQRVAPRWRPALVPAVLLSAVIALAGSALASGYVPSSSLTIHQGTRSSVDSPMQMPHVGQLGGR